MDVITGLSPLSPPGFTDDLDIEAYMSSVNECYPAQAIDPRRTGGHQLPESPPDSGSENPYSPETQTHAITVPQTVLTSDYMLVPDHIPTHEILQQNGDYIYKELNTDNLDHGTSLGDLVVLPQDSSIVELGIRTVRHDLGIGDVYQNRYNQMRVEMPEMDQGLMTPQLVSLGHESLTPVYTSLQEPNAKKRKHDDSSQVKCEPAASPESTHIRAAPPSVDGSEAGDDAPLQCIRFSSFQQNVWHSLYDCSLKPLQPPTYVVGADKGFNFSQIDEAFVCQKKNHFQVTCQIHMVGEPQYIKTGEGFKKIDNFRLHFYGVKAEDPSQEVRIEQSQSDRTKKPFHPVPVDVSRTGSKTTVGRLHFAETTNNNMRKKGRPNPDQRHFQLVVALRAHVGHHHYMVAASASDRIIVRASNPGQFESDCTESWWQRGVSENSVHFNGRVGINTDRPDECCVVNGNLKVMGHILHPSDVRAKHNIAELDTAQQLRNVQSIRVVKFNYDPSFAQHSGLLGYDPSRPAPPLDTGIIAQEVRSVLPEAVKEAGDVTLPNGDTINKFLVVNKDRIYMEGIGAVKELSKVTGNLESRIDQLEKINKKLYKISVLQRRDSARSSVSNDSHNSTVSNSSKSLYSDGNIYIDQFLDIARNIRKHERCHKLSHYSPKHTRKQCKNCHSNSTKYGKYYHQNKTCGLKYSDKLDNSEAIENPTYTESQIESLPETESNLTKKRDTCLWLRGDEEFSYGNSRMGICCSSDRDASSELISNKFLQIIITILIFVMAVCLIVMSALYFQEHKALVTERESNRRLNDHSFGVYKPYDRPWEKQDFNQIQNSKLSQHSAARKGVKDKGSHKTTQEYATTPPTEPPSHTISTTTVHSLNNFVASKHINIVPTVVQAEHPVYKKSEVVGGGCSYTANNNNELDPDCQSPCIDPPQTYDSQDDRPKTDKDNDTYTGPLETPTGDKLPSIPVVPEKNHTEPLKTDTTELRNENDSFKIDDNMPENNNYLESKTNGTEKRSRLKREVQRQRRDESSSEEMQREIKECDSVRVGIQSVGKPILNSSLFNDVVCDNKMSNFSYEVPVSLCFAHKQVHLTFSSTKIQDFRLCHQCNYDSTNACQASNRDSSKAATIDHVWTIKMTLECNVDKMYRVRASFKPFKKDICTHMEPKTPFIEYNIRIHRDCRN